MPKGKDKGLKMYNQNSRSFLHLVSLLIIFSKAVMCEQQTSGSRNSLPDQIAMPAEHRIGVPPGQYGPPPPPHLQNHPGGEEHWPLSTQHDMPQIKILQVQCEKSHMRVNIEFDRPFYGLIFSKGYYADPHCVHLAPGSGHLSATFDIYLDACGMSSSGGGNNALYGPPGPAPSGTFVENTIIIQYDPLVQEVWDQARKLRCTWYDFYEKSVTFRPFQVDMLHAVTANFLGDNLQCWMQIQVGKGPWASEVSGIVKIGQTMTMVLAIKDDENKFDMLVRNCVAHDGKRAPIQLVDQYGCVTRPKIMSRFHKIKNFGASASVVSYAYFQAFKFPDSMNVHFQCVIQVCRFQCPEPKCGGEEHYGPPGIGGPGGIPDPRNPHGAYSEKKESSVLPPESSSEIPEPHTSQPAQNPPPHHNHNVQNNLNNHNNHILTHPHHNNGQKHHNLQNNGLSNTLPPLGPPPSGEILRHNKPMPPQPSHVMLPPLPPKAQNYPNVKREGVVSEDDEEEEEESGPSFAALGGRPRSVDFERKRNRRDLNENILLVSVGHKVYKRGAQEMTDVETTRVIQVVAPGDVAFSLSGSGNSTSESSFVVEDRRGEIDGVCMSISSFVGGLVMLLLLLVVSSLVAAFLFVRVRAVHRKTGVFSNDYLKSSS